MDEYCGGKIFDLNAPSIVNTSKEGLTLQNIKN